jgi:beta-glucosidase
MNRSLPPARRADLLLAALTTAEKLALVHGADTAPGKAAGPYAGEIPAIPGLGVPAVNLADGPAGVGDLLGQVTSFPAPLAVAATFDPAAARRDGAALGSEARGKGINILLAPTVNIDRVPTWGRAFESLGEDPTLTSAMAAAEIEGIQSQGVVATVKHLAAYNQETGRFDQSADVTPRVLHEVYLRAFQAAVQVAHVGAVMASYNKVNGTYATENRFLLTTVLRHQWHYAGLVMSDWDATHSTLGAVRAGLDLEMPDQTFFGAPLATALAAGRLTGAQLDGMVRPLLFALFAAGLFDRPAQGSPSAEVTSASHDALVRQTAAEGTVLLRDQGGLLPLDRSTTDSLALIQTPVSIGGGTLYDPSGSGSPKFQGCGSAFVRSPPSELVTPAAGVAAAAPAVHVVAATTDDPATAAAAAARARVAVVVVHDDGCEDLGPTGTTFQGSPVADRTDLSLPDGQDDLVSAVARANPRTVVVVASGGPVLMPWLDQVGAVLETWYPGQQDGNSLADVLFGRVDPSGRLPVTFPADWGQSAVPSPAQYPGVDGVEHYREGLDVGYRHDLADHLTPLFPFGYGLSYTRFALSRPSVTAGAAPPGSEDAGATVRLRVENTGSRPGAEVVQVYAAFPPGAGEPPRVLAGFGRVTLGPGGRGSVTVAVPAVALSVWDQSAGGWRWASGTYHLFVGTSSAATVTAGTLRHG